MGIHSFEKKHLSANGLLREIRAAFEAISEPPKDPRGLKRAIPIADCLMSGLAVFWIKVSISSTVRQWPGRCCCQTQSENSVRSKRGSIRYVSKAKT